MSVTNPRCVNETVYGCRYRRRHRPMPQHLAARWEKLSWQVYAGGIYRGHWSVPKKPLFVTLFPTKGSELTQSVSCRPVVLPVLEGTAPILPNRLAAHSGKTSTSMVTASQLGSWERGPPAQRLQGSHGTSATRTFRLDFTIVAGEGLQGNPSQQFRFRRSGPAFLGPGPGTSSSPLQCR